MRVPGAPFHGRTADKVAAVAGDLGAARSRRGGRDCSVTWATPPMEASASPRKPSVSMRKRSSADGQLAGGVAGEGQRQVVGDDAAAVIDDADQLGAALLDLDVDAAAAGIDGVFEQFLDDAGRPFDDFAGGDLVDDERR